MLPKPDPELDPEWMKAADTLPIVVWTARPDGSIEFLSRRFFDLTGIGDEEVLDMAWPQLLHPEERRDSVRVFFTAIRSGEPYEREVRARNADGSYRWVHIQGAPQRNERGEIVRWFGVVLEIESLKRAEEALDVTQAELAETGLRFQILAEAIPIICWTADPSGWIDWYSRRWYEYTGHDPEDSAGWGWQAAHHPDDFLEVMRRWPQSIETGESFEMEFRLQRHDGAYRWFLTRAEPFRDRDGKIVRWYGTNVDIDSQKSALVQTRRIAETLQDVFLPKELPRMPGLRFDAIYLPAEKDSLVGGDWYDVFELPNGRIGFSMGDVAGHGLEASILVGRMRQAIYTLAFTRDDPAYVLTKLNRILIHQDPDIIVTALVGFIDRDRKRIAFASAGHPPPLLASRTGEPARSLDEGSPPLGVRKELVPRTHTVAVAPGDIVALYTDGMIEFTRDIIAIEERLKSAVSLFVGNTTIAHPALAVKEIVFDNAQPTDDAALLLIQFSDKNRVEPEPSRVVLEKTWRFHSSSAHSAVASRRQIVEYLQSVVDDRDELFSSELILGELLANTVEHAPGLVEVKIDWRTEQPVVTVRDTGPGLNGIDSHLPADSMSEDGRGLFLISALAPDVLVRPAPGYGTEIRLTLPIKRAAQVER